MKYPPMAKFSIGDRLLGYDLNNKDSNRIILHWEVRDMAKRYYSLWCKEYVYANLYFISDIDKKFELDIVGMRKAKLEKLNQL